MTTQANHRRKDQKENQNLQLLARALSGLASLLWQQVLVDVRQDTTLGDGDMSQQLVQLLIVPDSELKMTGNDTGLLVVASSIASQFEDLSGEVNGSTGTDTLSVVALAEKTVDTTDGERETGLGGTGLRVLGARGLAARFAAASHFERSVVWVVSLRVG